MYVGCKSAKKSLRIYIQYPYRLMLSYTGAFSPKYETFFFFSFDTIGVTNSVSLRLGRIIVCIKNCLTYETETWRGGKLKSVKLYPNEALTRKPDGKISSNKTERTRNWGCLKEKSFLLALRLKKRSPKSTWRHYVRRTERWYTTTRHFCNVV